MNRGGLRVRPGRVQRVHDDRSPTAVLTAVLAVAVALGGCGSSTSPSSSAPSAILATSTPSTSEPPATSRPSPSPAPATTAIAAFVALVTTKGFSYQATFTGESRHTTDVLPISKGVLKVHGNDALVAATFTFPSRRSYAVEQRWVGGHGWIRYDRRLPWLRLAMSEDQTMAAFAAVRSAADVELIQPITTGGRTLFQVTIRSAIVNPVMIPATNLTKTVVTRPRLTLLIDANGRPVSGTDEITGNGRVSGQLQEIVIDLRITFTKVGVPVSISAP